MCDIKQSLEFLQTHFLTPNKPTNAFLESIHQSLLNDKSPMLLIVGRDEFSTKDFKTLQDFLSQYKDSQALKDVKDSKDSSAIPDFANMSQRVLEQIHIESKYHSYIKKQQNSIQNMHTMLQVKIPEDFIYSGISGLSLEVIEKLSTHRPSTLFEASQISGITPASIDVIHLYIHLRKSQKLER